MTGKPLLPWTVLERRTVFRDRWVHLTAERCQTGAGAIIEPYYVFERADWACILPLDSNDNVVMVRVWRQGTRCWSLELPAGAIDGTDPSPAEAARRELLEETGYACGAITPLGRLATNPANTTNFAHIFLAHDAVRSATPVLEAGETLEALLMPFADVVAAAREGRITHAVHVAAILLANDVRTTRAGAR